MKNFLVNICVALVSVVIGLVLLVCCFLIDTPSFNEEDYTVECYTVKANDNLSRLGKVNRSKNDTTQEWVNAVMELNGMNDSTIYINQIINIYVKK